jgi:haloalkane dehalogenase
MVTAATAAAKSYPRPDWLPADVWPFETRMLEVDRGSIAVTEAGRGPMLLLYTGVGQFIWRDVIRRLAPDFRCITPDPPGIGLSAPVSRREATLWNSAKAVSAVIDAFDLRDFTLVAHDSGGPPSFAAAAGRPRAVRGIVGINTFGWRPAGAAFRGMLAVVGSGLTRQISITTGGLSRVTASSFGVGRHLDSVSRHAFRAALSRRPSARHP